MVVIFTVGGLISGYWLMGKLMMDNKPSINITIEITIAVTGRRIKVSAIMIIGKSYLLGGDVI
jgi:hypothetical protein